MLNLAPSASGESWQRIPGKLGSSASYNSGWLDLEAPTNFAKGEKLRILLGGTASKVVVRLLPAQAAADDQSGILGEYKIEKSRVLVITLGEDHEKTKQISVHGGPNPWGVWDLGGGNGAATIKTVEHVVQ